MGSHPHILAIIKDADQAKCFYMEVEKKLTDAIKRLLGVPYLNLWKGSPRVIELCDKESAIKMIAYYYANPAAANLVRTIDEYPGVSTWMDFRSTENTLDAKAAHLRPWIRLPSIKKLPKRAVTERQDKFITENLLAQNKEIETLEIFPNAWMECFDVFDNSEVERLNQRILEKLHHNQEVCFRWRQRRGRKVMGKGKLFLQPIMATHQPKKDGRRIFCISSSKSVRIHVIEKFKAFCKECRRCYERWRNGEVLVTWPPGAFLPPIPPLSNALG